jgi:nucleoside-diphosphate-sugar epimerase
MKKAFVTGANGFLGINLIRQLCREEWEVTAFHLPGEDLKYLRQFDIQYAAGDILDYQSLLDALSGSNSRSGGNLNDTIVFHLAGDTSMWHRNDKRQFEINVIGTENVCRSALEKQVNKLVFTSSISAYGYHAGRINEDTPSNALSCKMNYNRTKFLAEKEIRKAVHQGLDAVILNPCNIMGPYDANGWSTLISSIAEGKAPGVTTGIGTFAHVKDIAKAHIAAAERGRAGENYLLGGVEISFKEISEQINAVLGKSVALKVLRPTLLRLATYLMQVKSFFDGKEPLLTYPRYKRLVGNLLCDDSKARRELGFCTTDMGTMIRDSHLWLQQEKLIGGAES